MSERSDMAAQDMDILRRAVVGERRPRPGERYAWERLAAMGLLDRVGRVYYVTDAGCLALEDAQS